MLNFMIEYDQAGGGQEKCLMSKVPCNDATTSYKPVREPGQTRFGTVQFPFATLSRVTNPIHPRKSDNLKV